MVPTWVYAGDAYGGMAYYDPEWDEETLASARTYVEGIVKRLGAAGLVVEGDARQERDVAGTIVRVAEEATADLIVMSTQALTGPARALLGSVADAVARTSHCPSSWSIARRQRRTVRCPPSTKPSPRQGPRQRVSRRSSKSRPPVHLRRNRHHGSQRDRL